MRFGESPFCRCKTPHPYGNGVSSKNKFATATLSSYIIWCFSSRVKLHRAPLNGRRKTRIPTTTLSEMKNRHNDRGDWGEKEKGHAGETPDQTETVATSLLRTSRAQLLFWPI